jgi:DNA-binding response OmpR family regulator
MKILLVEDDRKLARALTNLLEEDGHTVEVAHDGERGLELGRENKYDVVVLDVMLPLMDGVEVCRTLRANDIDTPILMLTARTAIPDRVQGLDAGADDYLAKPFAFEEFLARVRALLRRGSEQRTAMLKLADLTLDPVQREVKRGTRRIMLTPREYALLEYFLRNAGRVLTRPLLAQHVWGVDFDTESNLIDVYVGYLRRKINGEGEAPLLHTVRGVGYVVKADT